MAIAIPIALANPSPGETTINVRVFSIPEKIKAGVPPALRKSKEVRKDSIGSEEMSEVTLFPPELFTHSVRWLSQIWLASSLNTLVFLCL